MARAILSLFAALALTVAGCGSATTDAPLEASVIGGAPRIVDPNLTPPAPPSALILQATAQGLVRFDATGQIEPALAERWIVSDEGRSFIFRLRPLRWGDGARLDAEDVARRLRATLGPHSRNPLKPLLGAIDEIVAVTPQVVDIRLSSPRPNLIQLLAQPEMAILSGATGSGPFAVVGRDNGALLLRPRPDPDAEAPVPIAAHREVRLRGERAGLAVARFAAGRSELVSGGTFADLAVARAADTPRGTLRFDPVAGLFGLAITRSEGFLGDADNRRAMAMAIDRDRIVGTFGVSGWQPAIAIVPLGLPDLPSPAAPDWAGNPIAERRTAASAQVARWRTRFGPPTTLRIAAPEGPGSRLLIALIAIDLRAIGVDAVAALPGEDAELVLIDAVAPGDIASWYLRRFACAEGHPCTPESEAALDAARTAPTSAERTYFLAEADRQLAAIVPFIPIASPLRWSLVAPSLDGWRESPRGWHPLDALRNAPPR